MRSIWFRGKYKENGEWVIGDLIHEPFGTAIQFPDGNGKRKFCVEQLSVGQYTGLADKNGAKIFEGDIVKFDNPHGEWGDLAYIIFECGEFRYVPITDAQKVWNCRLCGEENKLSVIGNIHDNPELIP